MKKQNNPNSMLAVALAKYDFDNMKNALLLGAEPDDMILHRVINKDRVDLLDYFLNSTQLQKHCNINYKYPHFGDGAAFIYACGCGAKNVVHYLMTNPNLTDKFDFQELSRTAFLAACEYGSIDVVQYLINEQRTEKGCSFIENNFMAIHLADSRGITRAEFVKFALHNISSQNLDGAIQKIIKCKDYLSDFLETLQEKNILNQELPNTKIAQPKKNKL